MHNQRFYLPEGLVGLEIVNEILNNFRTVSNGADSSDDPRVILDLVRVGLDIEQSEQLAYISNMLLEVSLVTSDFSFRYS